MPIFNKFQDFSEQFGKGIHHLQAAGDTLKIYLTNNAPSTADHAIKADLLGIAEEHGYAPADAQNDYSEAAGIGTLTCVDIVFTAAGGSFGPFRYAVLYNDTAVNDNLIAWWDYGSSITVLNGQTFTVDFGASIFSLT